MRVLEASREVCLMAKKGAAHHMPQHELVNLMKTKVELTRAHQDCKVAAWAAHEQNLQPHNKIAQDATGVTSKLEEALDEANQQEAHSYINHHHTSFDEEDDPCNHICLGCDEDDFEKEEMGNAMMGIISATTTISRIESASEPRKRATSAMVTSKPPTPTCPGVAIQKKDKLISDSPSSGLPTTIHGDLQMSKPHLVGLRNTLNIWCPTTYGNPPPVCVARLGWTTNSNSGGRNAPATSKVTWIETAIAFEANMAHQIGHQTHDLRGNASIMYYAVVALFRKATIRYGKVTSYKTNSTTFHISNPSLLYAVTEGPQGVTRRPSFIDTTELHIVRTLKGVNDHHDKHTITEDRPFATGYRLAPTNKQREAYQKWECNAECQLKHTMLKISRIRGGCARSRQAARYCVLADTKERDQNTGKKLENIALRQADTTLLATAMFVTESLTKQVATKHLTPLELTKDDCTNICTTMVLSLLDQLSAGPATQRPTTEGRKSSEANKPGQMQTNSEHRRGHS